MDESGGDVSESTALSALGDIVQEILVQSEYPVTGFVIFSRDGIDYRSPYSREEFKEMIALAAEAL